MVAKVKDDARKQGLSILEDGSIQEMPEPSMDTPGVPNWEIEELKSITDGHVLLRTPACAEEGDGSWAWNLDPYSSLPRLGTDALHPALVAVGAHRLRLKMPQGNDRARLLHDTL